MLHPQTRALLDLMVARQVPPTHTLNVADARAFYRDRRGVTQPVPPDVAKVQDLQATGPNGTVPVDSTGRPAAKSWPRCRCWSTTMAAAG